MDEGTTKINLKLFLIILFLKISKWLMIPIVAILNFISLLFSKEYIVICVFLLISILSFTLMEYISYKIYFKYEEKLIGNKKREMHNFVFYISIIISLLIIIPMFFINLGFVILLSDFFVGLSLLGTIHIYIPYSIISNFKFLLKNKKKEI